MPLHRGSNTWRGRFNANTGHWLQPKLKAGRSICNRFLTNIGIHLNVQLPASWRWRGIITNEVHNQERRHSSIQQSSWLDMAQRLKLDTGMVKVFP